MIRHSIHSRNRNMGSAIHIRNTQQQSCAFAWGHNHTQQQTCAKQQRTNNCNTTSSASKPNTHNHQMNSDHIEAKRIGPQQTNSEARQHGHNHIQSNRAIQITTIPNNSMKFNSMQCKTMQASHHNKQATTTTQHAQDTGTRTGHNNHNTSNRTHHTINTPKRDGDARARNTTVIKVETHWWKSNQTVHMHGVPQRTRTQINTQPHHREQHISTQHQQHIPSQTAARNTSQTTMNQPRQHTASPKHHSRNNNSP